MYYPIWRTTNYTTTASTITYRIVYGVDFVIFSGKAVKAPGESEIVVNLNGTCKNYLNSLIYTYLTGITGSDEITMESSSSADFHLDILSGGTWETVYSWGFVNDWSYDTSVSAITSGSLSEPINGHASPDMLVPYTYFLESGTTSVCYDIQ